MCGIAGAFDLEGRREFARERLLRMLAAVAHRGPDDEQVHVEPGIALGSRRLAIIDLDGGSQPMSNETGDVWVSFEGEWYDHAEQQALLRQKGHRFRSRCDTEVWVHAYEEVGEQVFLRARGQFSVAIWDRRHRKVLLGRDRVGIGPLFYTVSDGWLLWASEIKGILASGLVEARPDRFAIDYSFNFFSLPSERTCFEGIRQIAAGHFLRVKDGAVATQQYWDLDFPDAGDELRFARDDDAADQLENELRAAVRRRLVSEVPIGCYLSGGLDSTMVLALSTQERGAAVPSFTIGLDKAGPADERFKAAESATLFKSPNTVVNVTQRDIADAYPMLVMASEGPVMDTSAACMMSLARANRAAGNKVALTGEGADEALAGYAWFKLPRPSATRDRLNSPIEHAVRRVMLSSLVGGGRLHEPAFRGMRDFRFAQQIVWEVIGQSREWLYSAEMWRQLGDWSAYDEVRIPTERMERWSPLNQSIYAGYKILLPGHLLASKGDRPIRAASTEGRYPFLDETFIDFCARLAPRYKVRRLTDKWLLRKVAARVRPSRVQSRRKHMFRAAMSSAFLGANRPVWVDQLLSRESLLASGYFDHAKVARAREFERRSSRFSLRGTSLDFGLMGVISTQLWHHAFCGGGLAELSVWSPAEQSLSATITIGSKAPHMRASRYSTPAE